MWKIFQKNRLENNPSLHGRPKLLFFDLCRGDILNKGKTWGRTKSKKQDINKIPCGTDFFVGFATTPGIFYHYYWKEGLYKLHSFDWKFTCSYDLTIILTHRLRLNHGGTKFTFRDCFRRKLQEVFHLQIRGWNFSQHPKRCF